MKGETSGNLQFVSQVLVDCDSDTVVLKVFQIGPACHRKTRSCFDELKRDE